MVGCQPGVFALNDESLWGVTKKEGVRRNIKKSMDMDYSCAKKGLCELESKIRGSDFQAGVFAQESIIYYPEKLDGCSLVVGLNGQLKRRLSIVVLK